MSNRLEIGCESCGALLPADAVACECGWQFDAGLGVDPFSSGEGWELYTGDCLELLPKPAFRPLSADVVVADPPYMIGARSIHRSGARGTWADMVNAARWYEQWIRMAARILKPTGWLLIFGNWRSLPTYICATSRARVDATSCMVWDKEAIGTSGPRQLRPRWELILWCGMSEARIENRAAPDIFGESGRLPNPRRHLAEKPVGAMKHVLQVAGVGAGSVVVDPFAGSGSAGVAALSLGASYVGIEDDPAHVATCRDRLRTMQEQLVLS